MSRKASAPLDVGCLDRRRILQVTASVGALGLLGGSLTGGVAHADALTKEQRAKMTPEDIIAAMRHGNARFRKGPVLKELQSSHALLITGAMYNIETAAVEFFS
jgi:carbonic anhydrase